MTGWWASLEMFDRCSNLVAWTPLEHLHWARPFRSASAIVSAFAASFASWIKLEKWRGLDNVTSNRIHEVTNKYCQSASLAAPAPKTLPCTTSTATRNRRLDLLPALTARDEPLHDLVDLNSRVGRDVKDDFRVDVPAESQSAFDEGEQKTVCANLRYAPVPGLLSCTFTHLLTSPTARLCASNFAQRPFQIGAFQDVDGINRVFQRRQHPAFVTAYDEAVRAHLIEARFSRQHEDSMSNWSEFPIGFSDAWVEATVLISLGCFVMARMLRPPKRRS